MSTLSVKNIQLNQEGNATISIANSYNVVISVDGTEKIRFHSSGVNFSSGISINNTPVISGTGNVSVASLPAILPSVGTTGNVLTSNGTSWISQTLPPASNTINAPNFTGNIDANGSIRYALTALTGNTVNCAEGNFFTRTASGAASWFINNVPSGRAYTVILELTNGGTGTQTWFANTRWAGGTAPTLTASGVDVLAFITDDAGANWRGVALMTDSK